MYCVVTKNGKLLGPYLNLQAALDEQLYSGGHVYLLQGPVTG